MEEWAPRGECAGHWGGRPAPVCFEKDAHPRPTKHTHLCKRTDSAQLLGKVSGLGWGEDGLCTVYILGNVCIVLNHMCTFQ